MKTLCTLLKIGIWVNIGVFIGSSLYTWCGYYFQMNWYVTQAVPWHMLILLRAGFTAIIVLLLLIILFFVRKSIK